MSVPTPGKAADLLTELDRLGIQLEADGEYLRFRPREKVMADLVGWMKAHKAELLTVLATRRTAGGLLEVAETWQAERRELWEERAAILEYDANMPRPLAEVKAFQLLRSEVLAK